MTESKITASTMCSNLVDLERVIRIFEKEKVEYLHIDVMDGEFVPNFGLGVDYIRGLRKLTNIPLDIHLMIVEPEKYVEEFVKAGSDLITFHVEATKYPAEVIQQIKAAGAKAGIVLNPRTPVEVVYPFIKDVDMVLVMTVEPGFGGQKFMAQHVSKIRQLAEWKKELGLNYDIEVDGGITLDNVREVLDAGANVIVAGSAVFGKEDIAGAAKGFLEIFKEYE